MAVQREYLSPNEIAELLGVSPFTIRRYIKLGELRAVKLLGGFRVHQDDLKRFLKAHEVNPAEEELLPDEATAVPVEAAPAPEPGTPVPASVPARSQAVLPPPSEPGMPAHAAVPTPQVTPPASAPAPAAPRRKPAGHGAPAKKTAPPRRNVH